MGNLEDLINKYKQEADQLSISPSPEVWKNVSKEIKTGPTAGRVYLKYSLLTCALVVGISAIYFMSEKKPEAIKTVQAPVSVPKAEPIPAQPATANTDPAVAPATEPTQNTATTETSAQKKEDKQPTASTRKKEKDTYQNKWGDFMNGADMYHRSYQFRTLPDKKGKNTDSTAEKSATGSEITEEITIYPNPVHNELHLTGTDPKCHYVLTNTTGQELGRDIVPADGIIHLEKNILPGIYVLTVMKQDGTEKVIRFLKE